MGRNWTEPQKEAIYARGSDILVAAAAGSGKTAVLVERVIERITDKEQPVDLDRLLVVTFTNAAAAEMQQRIQAALTEKLEKEPENELLTRQLSLLSGATITTIHAFCLKILRANFHLLDLDPAFRLADTTENELMRFSALEEVIEEMYEDPIFAEDFLKVTEAYLNIKRSEDFYKLINHIYDFVMSLPNPKAWLLKSAEMYLPEQSEVSLYKNILVQRSKERIACIEELYDELITRAENIGDDGILRLFLIQEKSTFSTLLQLNTYDELYGAVENFSFETIPSVKKGAAIDIISRNGIKDARDAMKKREIAKLFDLFSLNPDEQADIHGKLYPYMRCISEIVLRLSLRFDEKKQEKNVLNFNDLEHKCYQLFVDENGNRTPLAENVKDQFDEILIDEYQDTSSLQEAIFQAIKRENGLFLVGDIKQSIYRFRNTNPELFREKKDRFKQEPDACERKIVLANNFRSRATVLEDINYIFSRLMSKGLGDVDYNDEEKLFPGAIYHESENAIPQGTEFILIETDGEEGEDTETDELSGAEAEGVLAAQRITELIEKGYQVEGKNGPRNICYRDICILMRTTKHADTFLNILSAYGIPCYSDAGGSFLDSDEIVTMLSFLRIIDNPHQDIPLLAVLRSQLYALTPEELTEIRLADKQVDFYSALLKRAETDDDLGIKLQSFLRRLNDYRDKSRYMSMSAFVWHIYMETGFYEAQSVLPGGYLRRLNLRLLYTRASAFEKTGLKGLYSFIRFIDEYRSLGGDYDGARAIGEEQDVVRIFSIHKSKGLEYPVVILAGLGNQFNSRDISEKILIHSELGYGPMYIDPDFGIKQNTIPRKAIAVTMQRESYSEELRILYVAMTRAREKLILLASGKNIAEQVKHSAVCLEKPTVSETFAHDVRSYASWLYMALLPHPDSGLLREISGVQIHKPLSESGHYIFSFYRAEELFILEEEKREDAYIEEKFSPDFSLLEEMYPYRASMDLPAKITVTELKRMHQEAENDTVYLYPRKGFKKKKRETLSGAEVGTATHTVMEHLAFHNCDTLSSVTQQINDMEEKGFLTTRERKAICDDKIFACMQSSLGQKLQQADTVLREVSFGFMIDGETIFQKPGQVMLQGMIDCLVFDDEGISVIDFKTDKGASTEEIKARYKVQLDYYRQAAEKLYGQKVCHTYLYLFEYDTLLEL